MIANAGVPAAARAFLTALHQHPSTRLIVAGGDASLEMQPGLQGGRRRWLRRTTAGDARSSLGVFRGHAGAPGSIEYITPVGPELDLSQPIGVPDHPRKRTGRFRIGDDQLLVAADGTLSDMSAEDLAVALIDEAEIPRNVQRRFTVGY